MVVPEHALIGWDAIDSYIESRWSIPKSTCLNYHKEMRDCGAVLKRPFGKIPNRVIHCFAAADHIDQWIQLKFNCSSKPIPQY